MTGTEHPCAGPQCPATAPEASFLCDRCAGALAANLGALGPLLHHLEITVTRQGRTGTSGRHLAGHAYALPYHLHAAELYVEITAVLADITATALGGTVDGRNTATAPSSALLGAVCTYLRVRTAALRANPAAGFWAARIARAVHDATAMIDTRPEKVYFGPCGALLTDVDTAGIPGRTECPSDLYAHRHEATVTCPTCKAVHDTDTRQAWLDTLALDVLLPIEELRAYARAKYGVSPSRQLIYAWKQRNHLRAKGTRMITVTHDDAPDTPRRIELFRVGDLVALAAKPAGAGLHPAVRAS